MLSKGIACLLQANSSRISKNFLTVNTAKVRFFQSTANTTGNISSKPRRRIFRKLFLFGLIAPTGSFLIYYQFLNDQEKRKARVKVESFGRALRISKEMLTIAFDYKWNLWGLDEV